MRPLPHPTMTQTTVADILHALSDPARLAIVVELLKDEVNCIGTLSQAGLELPKATASRHFRVLREAGIIYSEKRGKELVNRVRFEELERRFPGLLKSILRAYRDEHAKRRR